ncbi:MAG: hypothetical protein HY300_04125 [Verrucomicrobia bacterium]|nr:hypothetical protein [Verrucomicrobiota bacterium]
MLTSHELFGFMSPALSLEIVEFAYSSDKEIYRATLQAVAQARHVRPVFLEHQPRSQRHPAMIATLSRPAQELAAATLIRAWLLKQQTALLGDFLGALGIPHKDGAVEDLPASVDNAQLRAAIDAVLAKHRPEIVAVYLNAFTAMNDTRWANLDETLKNDPRLQLGG